ncbi:hypothetical protein NLU13_7584 [Sarocladium strictum]|uniref:Uncharacterized protein n=1 Tax=Sarocladium strictum TaxID=5046 RepID=A0AA39GDM3_SARSR|nr:hypothetical protein NLU13_7584 [Sarocladium strictum]
MLARGPATGDPDHKPTLSVILRGKSWIGFDLDDTLHEFRRASSAATTAVLTTISTQHGTSLPALEGEYAKILKRRTAHAFCDGRTSFDYRKERFSLLLEQFGLSYSERNMTQLLEAYESILTSQLHTKPGAKELLATVKRLGKNIIVITEGPQDAQQRTIEALGIQDFIDVLVTTNQFQVAKTDGLFLQVLKQLQISCNDMAYVGDSEERDMVPALASGIFAIHLAEGGDSSFDSTPVRISTLSVLQDILENV